MGKIANTAIYLCFYPKPVNLHVVTPCFRKHPAGIIIKQTHVAPAGSAFDMLAGFRANRPLLKFEKQKKQSICLDVADRLKYHTLNFSIILCDLSKIYPKQ